MTTHRVYTTPLPKKLGIATGMHVALLGAPAGFKESLGELPTNVIFTTRFTPSTKLGLCFVRSRDDLSAVLDILPRQLPPQASVWIIHPKQKGRHTADFNQNDVRNQTLRINLVDYKVCSVDDDWSALKFAHRKG
jgi:hypothetical protein